MGGLSVANLVTVTINLSPTAAQGRSFGTLLIGGDSNVIDGTQRYMAFNQFSAVSALFGVNAPETQAAELFFEQVPQPATCLIGRWFSTAAAAQNDGGILTAAEEVISNWTSISNGSFTIVVDGTTYNVTGLNFSTQTNLNGVASVITTALSGAGSTAVCTWNGQNFIIASGTLGAGVNATGTITLSGNPSYGVQASGTITLSGQPSNGDTVVIKGTTVTFVTGTPTGNQVQISVVDDLHTAASLQAFLQASSDTNLSALTYGTIGLVTTMTARVYGTGGNAYTLTKSGTNIAVSGSGTLAGGVAADTLTVNGTAITFISPMVVPSGSQVVVGPNASATSANLQAFLAASTDTNIDQSTYVTSGTVTTVTFKTAGTGGNAFTLAKSSSNITISGATLSGGVVASSVGYATAEGTGTDVSAQLMLTSSTSQALVPGFAAETPVQFASVMTDLSPAWYGLMFASTVAVTDSQSLVVSGFIEAQPLTRLYGVTTQNTNALSALVSNDLGSLMQAAGYNQSMIQYSSASPYAIASLFGRAFSVDYSQANATIDLMYKQEPGIIAESLSQSQAATLQAKNINVFVEYENDTQIIQYGNVSSGQPIDTIQGVDWLQNALQTAAYNALYTTTTKVQQTDAGVNVITTALSGVAGQAVTNGLVAPGQWNGGPFGALQTGQYLKTGYYIFAEAIALQSEADRQTRACPPIQMAIKLAGAIRTVDILVNVNA